MAQISSLKTQNERINQYTVKEWNQLQDAFFNSSERKMNKIKLHCRKKTKIISFNKVYEFKVNCYKDANRIFKYIPIKDLEWITRKKYDKAFVDEMVLSNFVGNSSLTNLQKACNIPSRSYLYNEKKNLKQIQNHKAKKIKLRETEKVIVEVHIDDFYKTISSNRRNQKTGFRLINLKFKKKNNKLIHSKVFVLKLNTFKNTKEVADFINQEITNTLNKHKNYKIFVFSDNAKVFKSLARKLNAKHILDSFHFSKALFELLSYKKNETHKNSNKHWIQRIKAMFNKDLIKRLNKLIKKSNISKIISFLNRIIKDYKAYIPKRKIHQIRSFINYYKDNSTCYFNNVTCQAESLVSKIKYQLFKPRCVYSLDTLKLKSRLLNLVFI